MLSELQTKDQVINEILADIYNLYERRNSDQGFMMDVFRLFGKEHIEFQRDLDILRKQGENNV